MENASKALLMAAGVLIGVLVLSLAAYLFASFSQEYYDIDKQNESQKLAQYNTQFTKYEHKKDLTIYDIINIVGYAQENNKNNEDNIDEKIYVTLNRTDISDWSKSDFDSTVLADQGKINKDSTSLPTYECKSITYNKRGKVQRIEITKN